MPVLQEQGEDDAGQEEHRGQEFHRPDADEAFRLGDVAGGAAHDVAGLGAVVEREGEVLDAVVEVVAQVVGDAVGEPLAEVAADEGSDTGEDGQAEDGSGGGKEGGGPAGGDALVNGPLDHLGDEQAEAGRQEHSAVRGHCPRPVGAQVAQKTAVDGGSGGWLFRAILFHHGIPCPSVGQGLSLPVICAYSNIIIPRIGEMSNGKHQLTAAL